MLGHLLIRMAEPSVSNTEQTTEDQTAAPVRPKAPLWQRLLPWVITILCFAYAAWEWLLLRKSPDADIRVDLLLIWLVIAIATVWAVVRAARGGLQRNNRAGVRGGT